MLTHSTGVEASCTDVSHSIKPPYYTALTPDILLSCSCTGNILTTLVSRPGTVARFPLVSWFVLRKIREQAVSRRLLRCGIRAFSIDCGNLFFVGTGARSLLSGLQNATMLIPQQHTTQDEYDAIGTRAGCELRPTHHDLSPFG